MSTICKLNPKVREDRSMRAAMARQAREAVNAVAAQHGVGSKIADEAHTIATFLERVHRSPYRTGQRKNELFQAIARELAPTEGTSGVQLAGQS